MILLKRSKLIMFLALTLLMTFALVSVVGAQSYGSDVSKQLADIRKATAKYHDIEAAKEAGYEAEVLFSVPNMGIHFTKNELLGDGIVDPLAPEVLVYEPKKNGGFKLVAVEYMALGERPSLFGHEFEDGPFPDSFTLHAWVWQANPNGMFAPFNPNVANVEQE